MTYSLRVADSLEDSPSGIAWEETNCLLCGGENWSPLVEAPDRTPDAAGQWFMVVQCQDCGLCFTNPRPKPGSIAQFYTDGYAPYRSEADEDRSHWWQRLPGLARNWRKHLPHHGERRLLDFGCGGGSFLLRMRRQGWNVVGVDLAEEMVDRLRDQFGLPVLAGSLPHPELAPASFDVITMWHSLEHVHDPQVVLRGAHQLLAPGGKLLVAVPNIDCLAFRWFGQSWNALDVPRHLVHFAPWTLRILLHRSGFRNIQVRMQRRSGWLRATARLGGQVNPHMSHWRRALQGRTFSNLASWYAYLTRQSDCMIAEAVKS